MATSEYHRQSSDEIFDLTCSSCTEQSKTREAVRYYVECQDYYCQACADVHKLFPAMRGHKLLNQADFKASSKQARLPQVPTERCSVHKTKLIDMYCRDHDDVGCTSCMAETHRSCKAVLTVLEVVNKSGAVNRNPTLLQHLTSLIEECIRIKSEKKEEMSGADKAKEKAIDEMKKQRRDLGDVLDQLENAPRENIEREHEKLSAESEEVKQRAEKYKIKLQRHVTALRSLKGNNAQLFVSEKLGQRDCNEITEATNIIKQTKKTTLEFTGDSSVRQALLQYKSLGEVGNHARSSPDPEPKKILYKVKQSNTLNVKLQVDKEPCDIRSCCFFHPECILLADFNNASLKRVNMQKLSVSDHCDMPSIPAAVCCVNTHEVAVCLHNRSIQFVTIVGHMKITRQVKLGHDCFGIACYGGKMYVTDGSEMFYVYETSGTLVKTVKTDCYGNNIFTNNRHVTCNTYNGNIYVADWLEGLVCFDKNGNYISSSADKIFKMPQGVCVDGRGNVFVCARGSENVVQIGSDGKLLGEVVSASSGLGAAWSVCFDRISNRLVVTRSKNDEIFIFDLE